MVDEKSVYSTDIFHNILQNWNFWLIIWNDKLQLKGHVTQTGSVNL